MKKTSLFSSILITFFLISSCENKEVSSQETNPAEVKEVFIDNPNAEETAADTSSTGVYQEEVNTKEASLKDALKADREEIEQEEGMSFCDCVKKNKKLTDIMMADETSDADFDNAMKELEEMKTGACKIMFPDQNNIEEQQAHQRRVKNCLN